MTILIIGIFVLAIVFICSYICEFKLKKVDK